MVHRGRGGVGDQIWQKAEQNENRGKWERKKEEEKGKRERERKRGREHGGRIFLALGYFCYREKREIRIDGEGERDCEASFLFFPKW